MIKKKNDWVFLINQQQHVRQQYKFISPQGIFSILFTSILISIHYRNQFSNVKLKVHLIFYAWRWPMFRPKYCSCCQTITRELATSANFSVFLRRSLVTRARRVLVWVTVWHRLQFYSFFPTFQFSFPTFQSSQLIKRIKQQNWKFCETCCLWEYLILYLCKTNSASENCVITLIRLCSRSLFDPVCTCWYISTVDMGVASIGTRGCLAPPVFWKLITYSLNYYDFY